MKNQTRVPLRTGNVDGFGYRVIDMSALAELDQLAAMRMIDLEQLEQEITRLQGERGKDDKEEEERKRRIDELSEDARALRKWIDERLRWYEP